VVGRCGTKSRIRINPNTGVLYMPKELLREGFSGDVNIFSTSITFTIIHPSADLRKVKESLDITLRDIELRLKSKNSNITGSNNKGRSKRRANKGSVK
jgi:hypothetical protein